MNILMILAATVSLTLAWNAPSGGPPPTGYKLYSGTSPGVYSSSVDVGNKLTVTRTEDITSIKYFAVSAYNSFGESPKSNEVSAGFPQKPSSLTVTVP